VDVERVMLVGATGTGPGSFVTDRFTGDAVDGMTFVVHALPDDSANVPMGKHKNEYTPNGPRALDTTDATGDSGAAVACGVIRSSRNRGEPGQPDSFARIRRAWLRCDPYGAACK
jgi:hypothetical protein